MLNNQVKLANSAKNLYIHIVQIGTGGTGGTLAQNIAQMLSIFKVRSSYVLADPDTVEAKNLRNQLFIEKDIGLKKAEVLARRYRSAYNLKISEYTESYIEDLKTLTNLFELNFEGGGFQTVYIPILISCVDNNYSRQLFHQYFENTSDLLYIDVGNESTQMPVNYETRPREEWTKEELDDYLESGWTGQCIIGYKKNNKVILEPIGALYPGILEDQDEIKPSQSCSAIVQSEPQRLLTNKYAAQTVITMLNEIFDTQTISQHQIHFHAKKGYMKGVPVCLETA
jgi:hypothetical protein